MKALCILAAAALLNVCGAATNKFSHLARTIDWGSNHTFTTLSGTTWSNVNVRIIEGDAIVFVGATSGARIPFTNLPPHIVERFFVLELAEEHERKTNTLAKMDELFAAARRALQSNDALQRRLERALHSAEPKPDYLRFPHVTPARPLWKITHGEYGYSRLSYQLILTNQGDGHFSRGLTLHFLDREGFEIEHANEYNLHIPPGATRQIIGSRSLKTAAALAIKSVTAELAR